MPVFIVDKNGNPLMPTYNWKKIRHLLKTGKAVIWKHEPFTVMLLYETTNVTQPIEISVDTGEMHIGISVKSAKHEYTHEQDDLLADEKERHDECRKNRRNRRNRKRYRKPRFDNRNSLIKEGGLAPSIRNKLEQHVARIKRFMEVTPITDITLEVGSFDTQALEAMESGKPLPEGTDYQHGPRFGYDNLREAVFARDNHTCICCGSTIGKIKVGENKYKSGDVILCMHHLGFKKGDHSDRMSNLATVCTRCHTSENHQPGGKLYDLEPKLKPFKGAAFMNQVRQKIKDRVTALDENIKVHITYGSVTKRERLWRRMSKTHANDAYCIGIYRPKHKARLTHYQKQRRNNRILEKFYDAVYIDSRTGKQVKASAMGCNRTNRKEARNSDKNLRPLRGKKISKGYRSIRKKRYDIQPGDILLYNGKPRKCGGTSHYGTYVIFKRQRTVALEDCKAVYDNKKKQELPIEPGSKILYKNKTRKILAIDDKNAIIYWYDYVKVSEVKLYRLKGGWSRIN